MHATSKRAPGPRGLAHVRNYSLVRRNYVDFFYSLFEEFGDVARVAIPREVHLFFHPDPARHVLKENAKNYLKSAFFQELHPLLGEGLLTSEGELWRRQRKLVAPAFQLQRLQKFAGTMTQAAEETIQLWTESARRNEPRNVAPDMMRLTFSIAGLTMFGSDVARYASDVAHSLSVASDAAVILALSDPSSISNTNSNS